MDAERKHPRCGRGRPFRVVVVAAAVCTSSTHSNQHYYCVFGMHQVQGKERRIVGCTTAEPDICSRFAIKPGIRLVRLLAPAWSLWSLTSSVVPMHSGNLHATLQGRLAVNSHGIQYVLVVVVYGFQSMWLLLCVMMASGVYMMYTASVFSARSCKIFEALLPRHWVFSVL